MSVNDLALKGNELARYIFLTLFLFSSLSPATASLAFPHSSKTLKIAIGDEPITLNPFLARDVWSVKVINLLFDGLYDYGPNLTYVPILASGPPEVRNDTLVIKLRSGLSWSDGSRLTTKDVKFTLEALKKLKPPHLRDVISYLKDVEIIDDRTLKMRVDPKGLGLVLYDLLTLPIVNERQWRPLLDEALSKGDPLTNFYKIWPSKLLSSGPFVLKSWRAGTLVLVRNRFYPYDRNKGISKLVLKVYLNLNEALLALRRGEVDYIWVGLSPGYAEVLSRERKVKLALSPGDKIYYLGFNLRKEPWSNLGFRKALSTAIDRGFIVTFILKGYGEGAYSLVPKWNKYWYNPNVTLPVAKLTIDERLTKAKEMLIKAGYGRGNGISREYLMLVPSPHSDPNLYKIAIFLQNTCTRLGIKIKVVFLPLREFINEVFKKHSFDLFLYWVRAKPYPDYLRYMFCSNFTGGGMTNAFGYSNSYFDKIASRFAEEADLTKAKEAVFKMQEILIRDLPCIPICIVRRVEVYRGVFTGWITTPWGIGNKWSFLNLNEG